MEPTEENLRAFDELHRRRAEEASPQAGIPPAVRARLPDLGGRHVLHLPCGTGEATADLVALGALVTGVGSSPETIATARRRAPTAAFVVGDVHELPAELLRGRFDLVYTGEGALPWIRDVGAWASGVSSAIRPGGGLFLHDVHPVFSCLDAMLRWREDYFSGVPSVGALVTAVVDAGLTVRVLEESPSRDPFLHADPRVPAELLLIAEKVA